MNQRKHPKAITSEGRDYQIRKFAWSHPSTRRPAIGRFTSGIAHRLRYVQLTPVAVHEGIAYRSATILTATLTRPSISGLADMFTRLEASGMGALLLTEWPGTKAILSADVRARKVHFIVQEPRLKPRTLADDRHHVTTRLGEWDFIMRKALEDFVEQGEIDDSASFSPLIIRRPSFNVDYAWLTPASKLFGGS